MARILTLIYGVKAPTESSLKKWSAAGAFRSCAVTAEPCSEQDVATGLTIEALRRPRRAGRPGLRLRTADALGRVHELWPFLADSDPHAVLELAVARTAEHIQSALEQMTASASGVPRDARSRVDPVPERDPALQRLEERISQLMQEMGVMKREIAQFAALRNNLITKLDDAVTRAREALEGGRGGPDALVEARRDRDMGIMKSTLAEILSALQRIEASRLSPLP